MFGFLDGYVFCCGYTEFRLVSKGHQKENNHVETESVGGGGDTHTTNLHFVWLSGCIFFGVVVHNVCFYLLKKIPPNKPLTTNRRIAARLGQVLPLLGAELLAAAEGRRHALRVEGTIDSFRRTRGVCDIHVLLFFGVFSTRFFLINCFGCFYLA